MAFSYQFKHPMTLKIKDKTIIMTLKIINKKITWKKLYFRQFYNEKI